MNEIEEAIKEIEKQKYMVGIDCSQEKDRIVICHYGEDAKQIIKALVNLKKYEALEKERDFWKREAIRTTAIIGEIRIKYSLEEKNPNTSYRKYDSTKHKGVDQEDKFNIEKATREGKTVTV